MSTIEATVSMMEEMPEEARIKVMEYAQRFFTSRRPANPFVPLTTEQILADLDKSHRQIEAGQGIPADVAMEEIGRRHGFI